MPEGENTRVQVGVLDGDVLAQYGLRNLFEESPGIELVSQVRQVQEAVPPLLAGLDVLLVAFETVADTGRDATEILADLASKVTVLVTSARVEPELVVACLRVGCAGFVWKGVEPSSITAAVRAAVAGDHPIHPPIAGDLLFHVLSGSGRRGQRSLGLTNREQEVLTLVSRGMSNKEIAVALELSVRTVKAHVSSILQKLGVADRTQAAVMAIRVGVEFSDGMSVSAATGANRAGQGRVAAKWNSEAAGS